MWSYYSDIVSNRIKTETVKKWPIPKTIKEVRSFLTFTGYYCKFILIFSRIVCPLNELLMCGTIKSGKAKKLVYRWEECHQDAFDSIREEHATAQVLAYAKQTDRVTDRITKGWMDRQMERV